MATSFDEEHAPKHEQEQIHKDEAVTKPMNDPDSSKKPTLSYRHACYWARSRQLITFQERSKAAGQPTAPRRTNTAIPARHELVKHLPAAHLQGSRQPFGRLHLHVSTAGNPN